MALPWLSANTCISIWRGAVMYFSISTRASPKADLRLAHRGGQRVVEIGVAVDPAHALAAAAGDRLDQHRIADLIGFALQECRVLVVAVIARHHRHAGLFHQRLGAVLQPHRQHRGRRRPDEDNAGLGAGRREGGVFRQEAVTGMDAVRPSPPWRPRSACRPPDSFALPVPGRWRAPRRRAGHAAPWRRLPNRPRWCASRDAWRCG